MNDATLPTSRPSSSSAESHSSELSDSKSKQHDVSPSQIHSRDPTMNGDAPEADNGKSARQKSQKRKRTSPTDQATLEAEYKRNPKPDKTARMEIVSKVSLGEKEVQIWFQNRRQNTRRKSRPLLPHEIAAFGLNGMAAFSSDPITSSFFGSSQDTGYNPSSSQLEIATPSLVPVIEPAVQSSPPQTLKHTLSQSPEVQVHSIPALTSVVTPTIARSQSFSAGTATSESTAFSQSQGHSPFLPSTLGYLSNRRNASISSFSTPMQPQALALSTPSNPAPSHATSCPERLLARDDLIPPGSQVRLSMSLDGKAELISSEVSPQRFHLPRPTPSNSAPFRRKPGGLQRSQSALPFGHLPPKFASTSPFAPRLPSGRSRDTRTWEFCCDTDARDELTTQAENESSGSALAAISLIRSTSSSTLKSNMNKRNVPPPNHESVKQSKKPKLARAMSSLAKLQGNDSKFEPISPSGDSDKENWVPSDDNGNTRRRPLPTSWSSKQSRRRILEEGSSRSSHSVALGAERSQKKLTNPGAEIFEDSPAAKVVDAEVEKFMRGEVSPSKKGDLDCIQGLLSLSQGNWR